MQLRFCVRDQVPGMFGSISHLLPYLGFLWGLRMKTIVFSGFGLHFPAPPMQNDSFFLNFYVLRAIFQKQVILTQKNANKSLYLKSLVSAVPVRFAYPADAGNSKSGKEEFVP